MSSEYPKCLYHEAKEPITVNNREEEQLLGDEWKETPAYFEEKYPDKKNEAFREANLESTYLKIANKSLDEIDRNLQENIYESYEVTMIRQWVYQNRKLNSKRLVTMYHRSKARKGIRVLIDDSVKLEDKGWSKEPEFSWLYRIKKIGVKKWEQLMTLLATLIGLFK